MEINLKVLSGGQHRHSNKKIFIFIFFSRSIKNVSDHGMEQNYRHTCRFSGLIQTREADEQTLTKQYSKT